MIKEITFVCGFDKYAVQIKEKNKNYLRNQNREQ